MKRRLHHPGPPGLAADLHAQLGADGKLAQIGSRIIDGFARKMADQFFERFQQAVEDPPAVEDTGGAQAAAAAPDADPPTKKKNWLRRLVD
jgi:hypothetical protein